MKEMDTGIILVLFQGLSELVKGQEHPFSPINTSMLKEEKLVFPEGITIREKMSLVTEKNPINSRIIKKLERFFSEHTICMLVSPKDLGLVKAKTLIPETEKNFFRKLVRELFLEFEKKGKSEKVKTRTFRQNTLNDTAKDLIQRLKNEISRIYEDIIYPEINRKTEARFAVTEGKIIFSESMTGSYAQSIQISLLTENHVNTGLAFLALLTAYNERILKKQPGARPYTTEIAKKGKPYFLLDDQIKSAALGSFLFNLGYFHKEFEDFKKEILSEKILAPERVREINVFLAKKTLDIFKENQLLYQEWAAQNLVKTLMGKEFHSVYEKAFHIVRDYFALTSETPYRKRPFCRSKTIEYLIKKTDSKYDAIFLEIFLKYVLQPFAIGEVTNLYASLDKPVCQVRILEYEHTERSPLIHTVLPKVEVIRIFDEKAGFSEGQIISLIRLHGEYQDFQPHEEVILYATTHGPLLRGKILPKGEKGDVLITQSSLAILDDHIGKKMVINREKENQKWETIGLNQYFLGETIPFNKKEIV